MKNQSYEVLNPLTEKTVSVVYRTGMRLFQFMEDNQLKDESNSKVLLEAVKSTIASQALSAITADSSKVTKYDESVYLKGNSFRVRGKLTIERGEADERHVELIREYRNKKSLTAQKAIEKANAAIEMLTGESITQVQQKKAA